MHAPRDPDLLAKAGRLIHGEQWQGPLSWDLGISRETLRRWLNGKESLPQDHGIWSDLSDILTETATDFADRSFKMIAMALEIPVKKQ